MDVLMALIFLILNLFCDLGINLAISMDEEEF